MKHSITYLEDTTIIVFNDGTTAIVDKNLEGWKLAYAHETAVYFKLDGSGFEISASGRREWHYDGLLHRDDGPAIISADGLKFWYQHGRSGRRKSNKP